MSDIMEKLKNKALLAPLAGISNLPFRLIARSFGCALAYTEMISANGLVRHTQKTLEYLKTCAEDKPLGMQIFGAEPDLMAKAAAMAEELGADLIDINMGCPVKKVVRTGAGAVLLKDPQLVHDIISAVKKAVTIPVTVKIRSGWSGTSINAVEVALIAEESGAAAIAIHARTADQGYSGKADWRIIAAVKNALKIPVIGNGDIHLPQDALAMISQTACDAVMIGRGALGNPWLFAGINQLLNGKPADFLPTITQRYEIIKKHWETDAKLFGPKAAERNFRKHLIWYTKGLAGACGFRQKLGQLPDKDSLQRELDGYFAGLL